jgi:hypothetical protein
MKDTTTESANNTTHKALTLDLEKYQAMLDAPDMTDAQKEELLTALWSIMVAFVDLGFELKPSQNSQRESCGLSESMDSVDPNDLSAMVYSHLSQQDEERSAP